jgi:hypothetical protein
VLVASSICAVSPVALADDTSCRGKDRWGWAVPDHAKLQMGGYLGLATIGVGYTPLSVLDVEVFYGWVPKAVGGTDIHSLALRLSGHVRGWCVTPKIRWTYLSGGIGGLMTFGRGFFFASPDPLPTRYYPVTAAHALVHLGSELSFVSSNGDLFSAHGAFLELTAFDEYVLQWLDNTSAIAPWEPWSMTLGYKASL